MPMREGATAAAELEPVDLLRRVVEGLPVAAAAVSAPGWNHAIANEAYLRLAGGARREEIGFLSLPEALAAAPAADAAACLDEVRRTGAGVSRRAVRVSTPPDAPTWWDFDFRPLAAGTGGPVRAVLVSATEVTAQVLARREAEEARAALAEAEARSRFALEAAGVGTWEWDSGTGRHVWSPEQFRLHGFDPGRGAPSFGEWLPVVREEDRPLVLKAAAEGFAGAGGRYGVSFRIRRPSDGAERWIMALGKTVEGAPGRMFGVNMDVTDAKRAEEALRESEDHLRHAVELSPQIPWTAAPDGTILDFSPRWPDLIGLPPCAVDGRAWLRVVHPEDLPAMLEARDRALSTGEPFDVEHRVRVAGGAHRWMRSRAAARRGQDGGAVLRWYGTTEDVHDRRVAEAALRDALEARELLMREADHRIKNSLMMVAGVLQMQRGRLADPGAAAALEAARARVAAIAEVHRALHQSPDLRAVDLGDMLRHLCGQMAALNPAVAVGCDAPAGLGLDSERAIPLGLVVSELLSNAAKHAYPDGAMGAVEVRAWEGADGAVCVSVSDRGVGSAAAAPSRPGSLGAAVVRGLAKQIGAALEVRSEPGLGTEAVLTLPGRAAAAPAG